MADKRIAELNALTATANTDLTLVSDTSASETKKITIENLFQTIPTYLGLAVTPATFTSGLGIVLVKGFNLVPYPAASIITDILLICIKFRY